MAYEFKMTRRVEFSDTDTAGIVHFTNYFRYMETAEHAFYRSLGFSVHRKTSGGTQGWPRLTASCSFSAALRFEDTVEIQVLVREKKEKTLSLSFIFRKQDDNDKTISHEVARGELTVIHAVQGKHDDRLRAAPIPPEIAAKIDIAPDELLVANRVEEGRP